MNPIKAKKVEIKNKYMLKIFIKIDTKYDIN